MKIFIRSSGGFANIQLQGEIDTADLPDDLAKKAKDLFDPGKIKVVQSNKNSQFVDGQHFHIRVSSADKSIQIELDEASAKPELFAICNQLIHEIVRRKSMKK